MSGSAFEEQSEQPTEGRPSGRGVDAPDPESLAAGVAACSRGEEGIGGVTWRDRCGRLVRTGYKCMCVQLQSNSSLAPQCAGQTHTQVPSSGRDGSSPQKQDRTPICPLAPSPLVLLPLSSSEPLAALLVHEVCRGGEAGSDRQALRAPAG